MVRQQALQSNPLWRWSRCCQHGSSSTISMSTESTTPAARSQSGLARPAETRQPSKSRCVSMQVRQPAWQTCCSPCTGSSRPGVGPITCRRRMQRSKRAMSSRSIRAICECATSHTRPTGVYRYPARRPRLLRACINRLRWALRAPCRRSRYRLPALRRRCSSTARPCHRRWISRVLSAQCRAISMDGPAERSRRPSIPDNRGIPSRDLWVPCPLDERKTRCLSLRIYA